MKIGLIDVDSHNFPNLALMKISAYHKAQGDTVEWANALEHYCGDFTILRHELLSELCHELKPHFEGTVDMIIIDCKERIPKCQEKQK